MDMEDAIASEVRAEVAARGLTAKAVQEATGISPASWGNYFVQRSRRIPLPVLLDVCAALRVLPEELMRRARERSELIETDTTRELLEGMTPRQRRIVQTIRSAE